MQNINNIDHINEKIKKIAKEIEPELISIRRELHQYPELGINLPKTHDIISRELYKIPNLTIREHMAGGCGIIAELQGKKPQGKNLLLRADIDALPLEEKAVNDYRSKYPGCMHACGHDGHATWLIGAAKILARLTDEFGGCIRFAFQPGEEVGLGADTMIKEDKVLENPKIDMAFAAHGWPSVESGKIGIVRRYAFGCVGGFKVKIIGKKGHASWPEQAVDPIAIANEIYQHLPAILTRTVSGTEPKILSVTYMQAGDTSVSNIIPQECVFGGTMRAVKKEVLEKIREEFHKEIEAVCHVYGAAYEADIAIHGDGVKNAPELLNGVKKAAEKVLGKENVYIIEDDNLGGENFAEYSSRVPSVYMFIGIKPEERKEVPGLHSPEYQFDDSVLAGAAAAFANIAIQGSNGRLEANS